MKIIEGRGARLGRLASYVAKEALKGEEIAVINCKDIIITGNKRDIRKKFEDKRKKVGSGQKGPKISRLNHLVVKRAIRGMLPHYNRGRGKVAFKRIRCYLGVPKEFENKKCILMEKDSLKKIKLKEIWIK